MTMQLVERVNEPAAWESVLRRDTRSDGTFVYAVATTGIFCRPSCPSRRPHRRNVQFFTSATAAVAAGFRPCRRCSPTGGLLPGAAAVQRARDYIDTCLADGADERITLDRVADQAGLSPHHLQRRFKQLIGLTPAEYARARKAERLKGELRRGETVSRATYGAGYGSSSRVYESAASHLGMTPGEYRHGGAGTRIEYVVARTSLGYLLVGATERGVCAVTLGDDTPQLEAGLAAEYPAATRVRVTAPSSALGVWVSDVVAFVDGERTDADIPLDVGATAFQWKVWRELQKIPRGETRSYSQIAAAIGSPKAARAVAGACARNHIAVVIPCHRVVRGSGELGGYRWGLERKRRLIEKERDARRTAPS